jgi:nitrogen regulatory protein PII
LHKALGVGATNGTIFLGEGTRRSTFLKRKHLIQAHKEILMISATNELNETLHRMIRDDFDVLKKRKGIAFSIPFKKWEKPDGNRKRDDSLDRFEASHYCIMTVVDKGRHEDCITAARLAGAKGGTVIHGHGAGVPVDYYFPLAIEPQKDIVMIISTKDKVDSIREQISSELELDKPGTGILFVLPVIKTSGLLEDRAEERAETVV